MMQNAQQQASQVIAGQARQMHGAVSLMGRPASSTAQDQAFDQALAAPNAPKNPLYLSGPTPQVPAGMEDAAHIAESVPAVAQALSAFASGSIAGELIGKLKGAQQAEDAVPAAEAWQKANTVLGVKPSAIRIGEQASDIESAATNPGRTLVRLGLDADTLSAMTPIQRQAAIAPVLKTAGKAVGDAIQQATDAGTTLDIGKSTFNVLKQIKNPAMQQQAVDSLGQIQNELGIENLREATPTEARQFRDALKFGARFNTGGDLSNLGALRANLYRAASSDLENAVPGLDQLNEAFSDLKGAAGAARNATAVSMVKPPPLPPPTVTQKVGKLLLERGIPTAIGAGAGAGGVAAYRALHDLVSGP